MSSVYVVCWIFLQTFQTYFCIHANNVDPDQTAALGPHCSDNKADDNCCDWQFKGQIICRSGNSRAIYNLRIFFLAK